MTDTTDPAGTDKTTCGTCTGKGCHRCQDGFHFHLRVIDGRQATRRFEDEKWTTVGVHQLKPGKVIDFPGANASNPVVILTREEVTEPGPFPTTKILLAGRHIDGSGEAAGRFATNASVLCRCDLYYPADGEADED